MSKPHVTAVVVTVCLAGAAAFLIWRSRPDVRAAASNDDHALVAASQSGTRTIQRANSTQAPSPDPNQPIHEAVAAASTNDAPAPPPEELARIREGVAKPYRRIYQDLAKEGRMTQAEADRIVEAVVDHVMQLSSTDFGEKVDPVAAVTRFHELEREFHTQIAAEFGQSRDDALRKYQKTVDARFQVDEMRHVLEAANMPLSEEQRSRMTAAAIDAGAYIPMPSWTGAESTLAQDQETFERIKQRDQKILSLSHSILSIDQLQRYESHVLDRQANFEQWLQREADKTPP